VRFQFRCGYCGVSETQSGGELTIDHFIPVSAAGDDSDDNLVYACFRCNLYKGDFVASVSPQTLGLRLLHPLRDDLAAHIREEEQTAWLEPLTTRGRLHIEILRLNRPELIAHRKELRNFLLMARRLEIADAENKQLRAEMAARQVYTQQMKSEFFATEDISEHGT
jgi:hypothetical protein